MADELNRKEVYVFTPERWYGLKIKSDLFDEYHIVHLKDDYVVLAVLGWDRLGILVDANSEIEEREGE